ncbi:MAG: hypothetical protein IPL50_18195 [Chitinophagaceae bacterium]|nr:hypothetical protein [Chitinophagaceae bacterium]
MKKSLLSFILLQFMGAVFAQAKSKQKSSENPATQKEITETMKGMQQGPNEMNPEDKKR